MWSVSVRPITSQKYSWRKTSRVRDGRRRFMQPLLQAFKNSPRYDPTRHIRRAPSAQYQDGQSWSIQHRVIRAHVELQTGTCLLARKASCPKKIHQDFTTPNRHWDIRWRIQRTDVAGLDGFQKMAVEQFVEIRVLADVLWIFRLSTTVFAFCMPKYQVARTRLEAVGPVRQWKGKAWNGVTVLEVVIRIPQRIPAPRLC